MTPVALFLSPHLDDTAFSAGATVERLAAAGWRVVVATVFTASVPEPRGFALRCQTDKGFAPAVDYLALRRAEDWTWARAARVAEVRHWPFCEAPHRGYESAAELFVGERAGDDVWREVAAELRETSGELQPDALFAPQGLGNHVDHLQVIRAVLAAGLGGRVSWWRDTPYATREPGARTSGLLPGGLREQAVVFDAEALGRKAAGCEAYASQVGFQFGGAGEVRGVLARFHRAEAERAGVGPFAERWLVPAAVQLWEAALNPVGAR